MNEIILIISTFSLYALAFIVLSLIAINAVLFSFKKMAFYFDRQRNQYELSSEDLRQQMNGLREKLDKIYNENKGLSVDCEVCEFKPLLKEVEVLELKTKKMSKKINRLKILVNIVLWILISPIGKILLYFGNIDFKREPTENPESK